MPEAPDRPSLGGLFANPDASVRRKHHPRTSLFTALAILAGMLFASSPVRGQIERPIGKTPGCATGSCHTDIVDRSVRHEPVFEHKCLECHEYLSPNDHTFKLVAQGEALCTPCHTLHEQRTVHQPVLDGRCLDCHDSHGSEHASLLHDRPEQLCLRCHQQDFNEREFVHGPVAVGACVICHLSHSSEYKGLLTDSSQRLCLSCHDEMSTPERTVGLSRHAPMEDGCTSCHDPHASDHQYQLESEVSELCFTCHDGLQETISLAKVKHGPVLEKDGCTKCHNPHFSTLPNLQKQEQPDICLTCHDESIDMPSGESIPDMARLLKQHSNHHGPIREGACTACHSPHASDEFSLLFMQYPPEFYAPFEQERYELCFACHLKSMVTEQSGAGITGFRDGELNLHWVHVNREKGRTCRACHEVHASSHPFHIRESVPFGRGDWELPINFEKFNTGGSCAPGCHSAEHYDRDSGRSANQ